MDKSPAKIGMIVLVTFVVVILIGQLISYNNPYYSNFSVERDGDEARYEIDSNLSFDYTAVSLDNGGLYQIDRYVAFYDDAYPVQGRAEKIRDSLNWLRHDLGKYHVTLDIEKLPEVERIITELDTRTAIVFATGTLPAEIYDGTSDSPLFEWLKAGGVMYWMNGKIGSTYAERGTSTLQEVSDYNMLFFGADDVVRDDIKTVYARNLIGDSLTDVLSIYFNECTNGVDVSKLITDFLELDYSYEGYSSVAFVKYHNGAGMICNLGGTLDHDTAHSVAQVIAPRLTYVSTVVDHHNGQISKDPSGVLQCATGETDVFIFIGTMTVIGGQCFRI
jgi:hypothetical protein